MINIFIVDASSNKWGKLNFKCNSYPHMLLFKEKKAKKIENNDNVDVNETKTLHKFREIIR